MAELIEVCGWGKFQHYGDKRRPNWIKLYLDLHHRDAFMQLTPNQRCVLFGIWIEYALSGRELHKNTRELSRKLNVRVTERTLQALNHAGFIRFVASEPLAQIREEKKREEVASAEEEDHTLERVAMNGISAWRVPA